MSKCRYCKRAIKWVEVSDGTRTLKIPVDPKSYPRVKHTCEQRAKAIADAAPPPKRIDDPWWTK